MKCQSSFALFYIQHYTSPLCLLWVQCITVLIITSPPCEQYTNNYIVYEIWWQFKQESTKHVMFSEVNHHFLHFFTPIPGWNCPTHPLHRGSISAVRLLLEELLPNLGSLTTKQTKHAENVGEMLQCYRMLLGRKCWKMLDLMCESMRKNPWRMGRSLEKFGIGTAYGRFDSSKWTTIRCIWTQQSTTDPECHEGKIYNKPLHLDRNRSFLRLFP